MDDRAMRVALERHWDASDAPFSESEMANGGFFRRALENVWVNSQAPANGISKVVQRRPHEGNVGF